MDTGRQRQRRQTAGALVQTLVGATGLGGIVGGGSSGSSIISNSNNNNGTTTKKKHSTAQPRPSIVIPPRGIGPVTDINPNDVLCGRGGRINAHLGNVQFRDLVQARKKDYLAKSTKKLEKAHIAADLVRLIRAMDPPGRFLKEDPDGSWYDIGDQKAIKKVGQALREDAPEVRQDLGGPKDCANSGTDNDDDSTPRSSPNHHLHSKSPANTPPATERTVIALTTSSSTPELRVMSNAPPTAGVTAIASPAATTSAPAAAPATTTTTTAPTATTPKVASAPADSPYQPIATQVIAPPPSYHNSSVLPSTPSPQQVQAQFQYPSKQARRLRPGAAVSGAAAAAMMSMEDDDDGYYNGDARIGGGVAATVHPAFDVPMHRGGDVAFGRPFHPPPPLRVDTQRELSLISGLSGPSVMSGMSDISALSDPMSSLSADQNGNPNHHHMGNYNPQTYQQQSSSSSFRRSLLRAAAPNTAAAAPPSRSIYPPAHAGLPPSNNNYSRPPAYQQQQQALPPPSSRAVPPSNSLSELQPIPIRYDNYQLQHQLQPQQQQAQQQLPHGESAGNGNQIRPLSNQPTSYYGAQSSTPYYYAPDSGAAPAQISSSSSSQLQHQRQHGYEYTPASSSTYVPVAPMSSHPNHHPQQQLQPQSYPPTQHYQYQQALREDSSVFMGTSGAAVDNMSMASISEFSVPTSVMSGLSESLIALDLAADPNHTNTAASSSHRWM